MPDYAAMYRKLFNAQTVAIEGLEAVIAELKKAHQETEEMYISSVDQDHTLDRGVQGTVRK
jgi:hypothetical protein